MSRAPCWYLYAQSLCSRPVSACLSRPCTRSCSRPSTPALPVCVPCAYFTPCVPCVPCQPLPSREPSSVGRKRERLSDYVSFGVPSSEKALKGKGAVQKKRVAIKDRKSALKSKSSAKELKVGERRSRGKDQRKIGKDKSGGRVAGVADKKKDRKGRETHTKLVKTKHETVDKLTDEQPIVSKVQSRTYDDGVKHPVGDKLTFAAEAVEDEKDIRSDRVGDAVAVGETTGDNEDEKKTTVKAIGCTARVSCSCRPRPSFCPNARCPSNLRIREVVRCPTCCSVRRERRCHVEEPERCRKCGKKKRPKPWKFPESCSIYRNSNFAATSSHLPSKFSMSCTTSTCLSNKSRVVSFAVEQGAGPSHCVMRPPSVFHCSIPFVS